MNEENVRSAYALGPGKLYIAAGKLSEERMLTDGILAGETEGDCTLTYEYKTRELTDVDGNIEGVLRYGEKVTVKGRLCRIDPLAAEIIGGEAVSALLRCPLPDGDEFRLHIKGGTPVGTRWHFMPGGGLEFELTCGYGLTNPKLKMKGSVAA